MQTFSKVAESRRPKNRRAFTLTEIAIVLGITGLVLGGIWTAASSVYNNMRLQRALNALLTIAQNMRSYYSGSNAVDPSIDMIQQKSLQPPGPFRTYIRMGIFPQDLLDTGDPMTAKDTRTPWGLSDIAVKAAKSSGASFDSFVIIFDDIPLTACIQLMMYATKNSDAAGMFAASGGPGGSLPPKTMLTPGVPVNAGTTGCRPDSVGGTAAAFWFYAK